jgi:hypothetical protein
MMAFLLISSGITPQAWVSSQLPDLFYHQDPEHTTIQRRGVRFVVATFAPSASTTTKVATASESHLVSPSSFCVNFRVS